MNLKITRTPQTILSIKILSIVGFFFLLYLAVNLIYLRVVSYNDIRTTLKTQNNRILSDLVYQNGKWDTSSYVNDYQIASNNPLYVITTDGFVIDREKPIAGLLDTSDFKYSSSFSRPQTITTSANEVWRLYSKVITDKSGNPVGTIFIGYYQPDLRVLDDIDNMLTSNADTIASELRVNGESFDTSGVDARKISVFLSFEIIDKFNHTLNSFGGMPANIDPSYIPPQLKQQFSVISDSKNHEQYMVYSTPILASQKPVGLIVSGYPLTQVNKDLQNQQVFSIGTGVVIIIFLIFFLGYLLKREITSLLKKAGEAAQKVFYVSHRGGAFGFDQDTGLIYLGDKKMEVPVKTKQYYICKVLFSKPNKNWADDEIVDCLPEHVLETEALDTYKPNRDIRKNVRMIYDAIRLLNEKAKQVFDYEAVLIQGRTYRINPNIQPQNE